jgi:hypothetical protein
MVLHEHTITRLRLLKPSENLHLIDSLDPTNGHPVVAFIIRMQSVNKLVCSDIHRGDHDMLAVPCVFGYYVFHRKVILIVQRLSTNPA